MSPSSSSKSMEIQKYSMVPLAPETTMTKTVKTTWSMENPIQKITITNETTQKNKLVADYKGNFGLNQQCLNKTTETVKNKCHGTVEKVTHKTVNNNGTSLHSSHRYSHKPMKYASKKSVKYYY